MIVYLSVGHDKIHGGHRINFFLECRSFYILRKIEKVLFIEGQVYVNVLDIGNVGKRLSFISADKGSLSERNTTYIAGYRARNAGISNIFANALIFTFGLLHSGFG